MNKTQRIFVLGEPWLYVKFYMAFQTADKILVDLIAPLVHEFREQKLIDYWFFVRYSDPDFHLRIRFHLQDSNLVGIIIAIIKEKTKKYIRTNLVWKVQYDTYNRELERYGGDLIEESEVLFGINSDCTVELVHKLIIFSDEKYRWIIALKIMDSLLSAFSFDLLHKVSFLNQYSNVLKMEFGFDECNSRKFNIKYKEYEKYVQTVLNDENVEVALLSLNRIVQKYNRQSQLLSEIIKLKLEIERNITIDFLVFNYVHMALNRLFRLHNRKYELILYDFMYRHYIAKLAKLGCYKP